MSKVDSLHSNPASGLDRRGLLRGAGGIVALAAAPAASALGAGSQAGRIAEIRRLHTRHQDLITYEMSIEVGKSDPARAAYETAVAASEAAGAELDLLCERILHEPVQSWQDVAVRAELAKSYAHKEEGGGLTLVDEPCDLGDATLGMLLEAALIMGGANV